jgi:hypothetical protein
MSRSTLPIQRPTNTPNLSYSVNYLPDSFPPQMTPGGLDKDGAFTMVVGIPSTLVLRHPGLNQFEHLAADLHE